MRSGQVIPMAFTDEIKSYRDEVSAGSCPNYHKVASIPAIFVTKFMKEGFNVYKESPRAVIAYLKRHGLEDFIATNKRV